MSGEQQPMHPYCPFLREEWEGRLDALGDLLDAKIAPVTVGISGIQARLDRLNGSVANHEKRLTRLETQRSTLVAVLVSLSGWAVFAIEKLWK